MDDATYFVTWRVARGQEPLSSDERTIVLDAMRFFHDKRYDLIACVVMDDHAHALVHPRESIRLEKIMHSWKSFTSNIILKARKTKPPLWQDESFDRIIRDAREFDVKLDYIWNNPFKRWPELDEYPWVWWPDKETDGRA